MNCEKARKTILLYDELDVDERLTTDQHLSGCKDCAAFFKKIRRHHALVKETMGAQPETLHQPWLTEKIMSRIEFERQRTKTVMMAERWLFPLFTWRHALALATALLVFTFFFEYNAASIAYPVKTMRMAGLVTLDSRQILESIRKEKDQAKREDVFKGLCLEYCNDKQQESCDACIERFR